MKKGTYWGVGLAGLALAFMLGASPAAPGSAADKSGKPYLGVHGESSDQPGVILREVSPDSPAAKAGLKTGDRVLKWNGQDVKDWDSLVGAVAKQKPGDKATVQIQRDGKAQDLTVEMGERPSRTLPGTRELPIEKSRAYLGVQTQELNGELKRHLDLAAEKGVVVTNVMPNTPAAKAGLKSDDVITAVDGKEVNRPEELRDAIHTMEVGKEVTLHVWRGKEQLDLKTKLEAGPAGLGLGELPPDIQRRLGQFLPGEGQRFNVKVPPIFESIEKIQELEGKVKEMEKRIQELEQKLNKTK